MGAAFQLVVGTAGHIDHGKSRLVLALTGTDPDRLPEEKARGMTIDLGFAYSRIEECDVWFVDVPGHERFIRNMVAGATGIDAALFVVAADDSVMPQSREHAEVLSLLGVRRCVIVLAKMDLVDEAWADQVEQEARGLLAELGLVVRDSVRVSAQTGRGIESLRTVLARMARETAAQTEACDWFRLPVDRAFNVPGRGTVVTGSVVHGAVQRDDELELWPRGRTVRVRDLQTHHEPRAAAHGRMRLAINLAGVSLDEVSRGCELATAGYLEPTRLLEVWLSWLRRPDPRGRSSLGLRLHIGTTDVPAELRWDQPSGNQETRGQFGRLRLGRPIVAAWGQRFILRDASATRTLGGGRVLNPVARSGSWAHRPGLDSLERLLSGQPDVRLEEVIRANAWEPCSAARLAVRAGLKNAAETATLCTSLAGSGRIEVLESASWRQPVHLTLLTRTAEFVAERLAQHLAANPRSVGVPRGQWSDWMPRACPARLRTVLADGLIQRQWVTVENGYVVPRGYAAAISADDQALLEELLREFDQGGFQPPPPDELRCATPRNQKRVRELIALAAARGRLVRIGEELWLHERRWKEMIERVTKAIRERGGLTVAEVRDLLASSRKYVVPLVEQLDAAGITRRVGDRRVVGPRAPT